MDGRGVVFVVFSFHKMKFSNGTEPLLRNFHISFLFLSSLLFPLVPLLCQISNYIKSLSMRSIVEISCQRAKRF